MTPEVLMMYHRALPSVARCFPRARTVPAIVQAMQGPQHIHRLNRPGVLGSRERDALMTLDRHLYAECRDVVTYSSQTPFAPAVQSFGHLVAVLQGWITQTRTLQLAMQRCEYLGDYNDVRDVRCVPSMVAHLPPYLASYHAAQRALRAFRARWHLVA
jgi:hypothetical protein